MPHSEGVDPTLGALRKELESIDLALVLGLRARERVQHRILEWKRGRAAELVDPRQEERVRRRARAWARASGGDPDLAGDLVLAAIRSGLRRFARPPPAGPEAIETVTCFVDLGDGRPLPPPSRISVSPGEPGSGTAPPTDAWVLPRADPLPVAGGRPARGHGRAPAAGGRA